MDWDSDRREVSICQINLWACGMSNGLTLNKVKFFGS